MKTTVLVVDDEHSQRRSLSMMLQRHGFEVANAASGREALTLLEVRPVDFALIDQRMPEMDGLELLRRIQARWPEVVVIVMTAFSDVSTAIESIKAGAFHYLEKPIKQDELLETIAKATPERRRDPFHGVTGESAAMRNALAQARNAAAHDRPVLITGEIGTGKETLAAAIHAGSARARHPFVPVRCAAGGSALEREIFGRSPSEPGRLVETIGGTVFLDRVETLPESVQDRLLRFLQDGDFVRDGEVKPVRADVRVIASSSTDLAEAPGFRDDLRLLIGSIHIHLPPLRERPADIPSLARRLVDKYTPKGNPRVKIGKDALAALQTLPWEGNVIELEGLLETAVALAGSDGITVDVLRDAGVEPPEQSVESAGLHPLKDDLEREEARCIAESLARNNKNLKLVAIDLGISRTSLWRKMKRYGLAEP